MCLVARKIATGVNFSISSLHDKGAFVLVSDHARQPSEFDPCQPGKKALPWRVIKSRNMCHECTNKILGTEQYFLFVFVRVWLFVCLFVLGKAGTC